MDTPPDLVLQQLRKLREGRGLTEGRLERSGAVMSALGTSDPAEALVRLVAAIAELGDGNSQRALRVDYGLDLDSLLGRIPATRERDWLGDRRQGYGQVIGRDVKTLTRWSDGLLPDLRARLIADTFVGNLYVVALADHDRITAITITQEDLGQSEHLVRRTSMELPNASDGPSIPALIYAFPRDWRPASLNLAVTFLNGPIPEHIWATQSDALVELAMGSTRYPLQAQAGTASCRFVAPERSRVYGLGWMTAQPTPP